VTGESLVIAHLKQMPIRGINLRRTIYSGQQQAESGQQKTNILDSLRDRHGYAVSQGAAYFGNPMKLRF